MCLCSVFTRQGVTWPWACQPRMILNKEKRDVCECEHFWVKALHNSCQSSSMVKVYAGEAVDRSLAALLFEMESNLQPTFGLITRAGIRYPFASLSFGPE